MWRLLYPLRYFRLVNNDVMDLYDRVPVGTKVIVHQRPAI